MLGELHNLAMKYRIHIIEIYPTTQQLYQGADKEPEERKPEALLAQDQD